MDGDFLRAASFPGLRMHAFAAFIGAIDQESDGDESYKDSCRRFDSLRRLVASTCHFVGGGAISYERRQRLPSCKHNFANVMYADMRQLFARRSNKPSEQENSWKRREQRIGGIRSLRYSGSCAVGLSGPADGLPGYCRRERSHARTVAAYSN